MNVRALLLLVGVSAAATLHAEHFQPPEVGAKPLTDRLVVIDTEMQSLAKALSAPALPTSDRAAAEKRVAELESERNTINAELKHLRELSGSPLVNFSAPPSQSQ